MIGSLTIEKANLNISYMLASLKILSDADGVLSRTNFISKMATFMGTTPTAANGGENRVPYNKTKFDRYFGFIDVNQNGDLLLTPRGGRIASYIKEKNGVTSPDVMYEIDPGARNFVQELFLDSCCFDSFGSYNCGAETSNSDVEPPRMILKSLDLLGEMNKWELGYVLWGLDSDAFDSFDAAIKAVVDNRKYLSFDYPTVIDNWGKINFVKDFKMVDLLADENVGLISGTPNGGYCIAHNLSREAKNRIAMMNPIMQPTQMFLRSSYSQADTLSWVRSAVLGRIADPSLIYECDMAMGAVPCKQEFAKAINNAYSRRKFGAVDSAGVNVSHLNSTVTLIIKGLAAGMSDFDVIAPDLGQSFARKNDFKANDHGWTDQPGRDRELYDLLIAGDTFATRFGLNNIVLPANLNIIGVN